MNHISKERKEEILSLYRSGKKDLFNWCDEYKDFVSECVLYCVSYEWEYMLKKSHDDPDSPISYEDLDLFDIDRAKDSIIYLLENDKDEDELKELFDETNEENNLRIKSPGDYKVYLNSLDKEELKELCNKFDLDSDQTDGEVYEWWLLSDPLKYQLEKQEEIFLNGAWGRQGTGQSIALDYCIMKAFINFLEDNLKYD